MKPGESGKYWYITEDGKFVSTYAFQDYDPPSDLFPPVDVHNAEVYELRRPQADQLELPKAA